MSYLEMSYGEQIFLDFPVWYKNIDDRASWTGIEIATKGRGKAKNPGRHDDGRSAKNPDYEAGSTTKLKERQALGMEKRRD